MKAAKVVTAALTAILCFSLTGCSLFDLSGIDALLRPPGLTGENAELQHAFEKTVGKNVNLFSPISGNFRSAYITFDFDGDGTKEAVIFYSLSESKNAVHMNFMARDNGGWHSVADTAGNGTDIYKVDIFDLDADGKKEIAVIWLQDASKRDKTMSLYKLVNAGAESGSAINSVATIQLVDYIHLDIDGDLSNELLYFYFDIAGGSAEARARLLKFDAKTEAMLPISEVKLNPQITSIMKITADRHYGERFIYADCLLSDSTYCTELLLFDKEKSVLVLPATEEGGISSRTLRNFDLTCTDFNGDGFTDMPAALSQSSMHTEGVPEQFISQNMLVEWLDYFDGALTSAGKYLINGTDGFSMLIDEFFGNCRIEYDYKSRKTSFCSTDDKMAGAVLFSVKRKSAHELSESSVNSYLIDVTENGKSLNISETQIKKLISNY